MGLLNLLSSDIKLIPSDTKNAFASLDTSAGWELAVNKIYEKYCNKLTADYKVSNDLTLLSVADSLKTDGSLQSKFIDQIHQLSSSTPSGMPTDAAISYNLSKLSEWLYKTCVVSIDNKAKELFDSGTITKKSTGKRDNSGKGDTEDSTNQEEVDNAKKKGSDDTEKNTLTDYFTDELKEDEMMSDEEFEVYTGYIDGRSYDNQSIESTKIRALQGVHGMPYQFLAETDRRLFDNDDTSLLETHAGSFYMGRKYIERIAARANILFLTPGKVRFLKTASDKTKRNILKGLVSNFDDSSNSVTALLKDRESFRYYSFDFDVAGYFEYLNPMLRAAARYLGIHNQTVRLQDGRDVQLGSADYSTILANGAGTGSLFNNAYGALAFYLDGVSTSQDSISTELVNSSFVDGTIKQASDTAQEIAFLAGKAFTDLTNADWANNVYDQEKVNASLESIDSFVNKYLGNNSLARKLASGVAAVATGGQIIFPKIWRDTEFERSSINVDIKLTSPDCDAESIFWNILVPMYALICMTAPKGYVGVDGYASPFMVRAFCQSMFNIEAGFITNISMRKGGEGCWTKDGLPTCLEISLTISDIYNNYYISTGDKGNILSLNPFQTIKGVVKKTPFLKNTAMLNWIANTCGVNVNKPDIIRDIEMYITHSITNAIPDLWTNFQHNVTDMLRNFSPELLNIVSHFTS